MTWNQDEPRLERPRFFCQLRDPVTGGRRLFEGESEEQLRAKVDAFVAERMGQALTIEPLDLDRQMQLRLRMLAEIACQRISEHRNNEAIATTDADAEVLAHAKWGEFTVEAFVMGGALALVVRFKP